jgi:hypothetical protein
VTIITATHLANDLIAFAARVKTASRKMRKLADRIRSTSAILSEIGILIGLTTDSYVASKLQAKPGFKHLKDARDECDRLFESMTQRISDANKVVFTDASEKTYRKNSLTEEDRDKLLLMEIDLDEMEADIEYQKSNLQLRLTIFTFEVQTAEARNRKQAR